MAYAGTYVRSESVAPPMLPAAMPDDCFGPGWELGFFGSDFIGMNSYDGNHGDNGGKEHPNYAGGGVTVSYFFTRNFGLETSYNVSSQDAELHSVRAALVARFPIADTNFAPYVLAGGGVDLDSFKGGAYHAGVGVEYRFPTANCMGIFTDGTYNIVAPDNNDHILLSTGVQFKF